MHLAIPVPKLIFSWQLANSFHCALESLCYGNENVFEFRASISLIPARFFHHIMTSSEIALSFYALLA